MSLDSRPVSPGEPGAPEADGKAAEVAVVVLLVDERPETAAALEAALADTGHHLVSVASGPAALAAVERDDFALVLLGWQAASGDGLALVRALRAHPRASAAPLIVVGGGASAAERASLYEAGAVDVLAEPLERAALRAKLVTLAELGRLRRKARPPGEGASSQREPALPGEGASSQREPALPGEGASSQREPAALRADEVAERATRQEQFLAMVNDAVPALVAYVGVDERYHFVNARYAGWFKVSTAEIVGKGLLEMLGERAYETVRPRVAAALGGQVVRFLSELDYGGGVVRWVEATYTPHVGPDGAVLGFVSLALDVTDRKLAEVERERAERALEAALGRAERERARFYSMLQGAPAIINVFRGPEHVFDFANERFCELLPAGVNFVGKPVREAQPELAGTGVYEQLDEVYRTGEPFVAAEAKVPVDRGDRLEERYFSFTYQPVRDADGRVEGVASFAFDVTDSVRARQAVEELARREQAARKVAEEAGRTKDEFLSTLSHELRTPLNAILGWANLLRAGTLPEAQRPRALETVERNARVQARLIDDLLDLSRIVQGKLVLSVGPLEMVRVVEAALDAVRPAAEAKGVRLQPVLDSHATIVGDEGRLQQVVWNLLSNAIKFTPKGGRVQVLLRRARSSVEVVVVDTGQGIDPDFLPHVFDRFRQADGSITRLSGGLGLGLAIVRSLVELHGGTVAAASEGPGKGASFVVCLPTAPLRADQSPAPEAPPGLRPALPFECPPELKGLRILVVDDEADTRDLVAFLLGQCEAVVRTAGSAAEAFAALRGGTFEVLVSDVGLPDEDGYGLLRRIRALPAAEGGRIPALALTAYARSEDRTAALRAGFQAHVAKPVEAGELVAAIAAIVGR